MPTTPSAAEAPSWQRNLTLLREALKQHKDAASLLSQLDALEQRLKENDAAASQTALADLYTLARQVNLSLDWTQTLEEALKALVSLTHAERGLLILLDEQNTPQVRFVHTAALPSSKSAETHFSQSIVKEALLRAQPILTSDAQLDPRFSGQDSVMFHRLRSVLCAPLIALGRPLGVIYLEHRAQSYAFSAPDMQLLSMAAELTALALTNAQKYQHLQQRLNARIRDLRFLRSLIEALDADYNYMRILHQSLSLAMQAVGATQGALGTLEPNGLRWQVQQGGIVLNSDVMQAVLHQRRPLLENHQMILPLLRAGHPIGLLVLNAPSATFSNEHHTLAQQVAGLIALFLESARLYEALRVSRQSQWAFVGQILSTLQGPLQALEAGDTQAIQALRRIWDNLSTFTLLEEGRYPLALLPVKLRPALETALEACRSAWQSKRLHVELHLPDALPPVLADSEALHVLVSHLLSNAIAYTPPGGKIYLHVDVMPGEADTLLCSIEDTGYGINLADQEYIFTPFFRSQDARVQAVPGSGLGLAIVKRLVEIHGGRVGFRSVLDEGSTFYFTLPKSDGSDTF